jgi:carboxymethylenebutenolidase
MVFYGTGPDKADDIARINCPVLGFYGENDARVNETIPKSEELMKAATKTYEPVKYPGAGMDSCGPARIPPATKRTRRRARKHGSA